MNLFEGVFNMESIGGILIMIILIIFTTYNLIHAKNIKQREHYMVAIGIELLILYLIIYTMKHFSSKTKSILGIPDII